MTQMINDLGENMVILMRVVNIFGLSGNKLAHELNGMTRALKAMGIEYEFEYNDTVDKFTAVTIMGMRFDV